MQVINGQTVSLGPAPAADARVAAELIHATDPHVFGYLHAHDMDRLRDHLGRQWQAEGGIFSHRLAVAALHEGRMVGLALGFDRARQQAELLPFLTQAQQWLDDAAFRDLARWFEYGGFVLPPVPEDAFYLQNLATVEAVRGRGVGQRLLADVIERAQGAGLTRLQLDLYAENPARALYERAGLRTIVETRVRPLEAAGIGPHLRMELKF
ncbi:MAG: GNAT family N-acetyltransferase [Pseudomonadales bacterium]|jgi:ribosomal protein S18 acetylase RimI-like enzyme|nr:GNAT family N-acetyltransferase [Pseudomonadales bacterium]